MFFFETIKVKNNTIFHLDYHQKRVNETCEIAFGKACEIDLKKVCETLVIPSKGTYKIRIEYGINHCKSEVIPYSIHPIEEFELVFCDTISYPLKSVDRSCFETIKKTATNQEIIIVKNGFVTDTSFSNIVFYDKNNWVTPCHFLLNGTCRQRLLNEKKIQQIPIKVNDIFSFEKIGLINAMLDLEEFTIDTNHIFHKN